MDSNSFDTNDTNPAMKILKEIMKINPDTKYSKLKIDTDETLLTALMDGPVLNGGFVSTEKLVGKQRCCKKLSDFFSL
jgi:hypothetical protein